MPHGQTAPIDAQNRVSLGKALSALDWDQRTFLVAARENGHYVIRTGADSPLLIPVPVDGQRRLTLPPAVLATLDVRPATRSSPRSSSTPLSSTCSPPPTPCSCSPAPRTARRRRARGRRRR
jgi:hypothetical protein